MPRARPKSNTSQTLAHFFLYLRMTHQDEEGRPTPISQGQLAHVLGYKSAGVISELEDPEKCRATYEHIERYADYFAVPAGIMLLITRITATAKYAAACPKARRELDFIGIALQSVGTLLKSNPGTNSEVLRLLEDKDEFHSATWEVLFGHLLSAFRANLEHPLLFRNSSARRIRPEHTPRKRRSQS